MSLSFSTPVGPRFSPLLAVSSGNRQTRRARRSLSIHLEPEISRARGMSHDKVNPTPKPDAGGGVTPKPQPYSAARPVYRPQHPPRRHKRGCCCRCCLWTTFLIAVLLLLAAIAAAAFWVLYRPQRPTFAVNSLRLSQFNLTSAALSSKLEISISARNPNKKVVYVYDPVAISAFSDEVSGGARS
ncbi:hypothetical protein DM860_014378 [Cuscuta australis]|uniref:Late embryogenesis abundant protein LEA-2 subgroup domain-containing protein n=1 Tax=Cuscuta australis TaxID=267555 RepID=A0A328DDT9_9ASTE|nr:hypothetical protein DM860_014378 [Cuscuta australis]